MAKTNEPEEGITGYSFEEPTTNTVQTSNINTMAFSTEIPNTTWNKIHAYVWDSTSDGTITDKATMKDLGEIDVDGITINFANGEKTPLKNFYGKQLDVKRSEPGLSISIAVLKPSMDIRSIFWKLKAGAGVDSTKVSVQSMITEKPQGLMLADFDDIGSEMLIFPNTSPEMGLTLTSQKGIVTPIDFEILNPKGDWWMMDVVK